MIYDYYDLSNVTLRVLMVLLIANCAPLFLIWCLNNQRITKITYLVILLLTILQIFKYVLAWYCLIAQQYIVFDMLYIVGVLYC